MSLSLTLLLAVQVISSNVTSDDIFTATPDNLAIVAGRSLRLECGVAPNLAILWSYQEPTMKNASVFVYNGEKFGNKFVGDFSVDSSIVGHKDLVAKNTRLEHAGFYDCVALNIGNSAVQRHSAKAQLIVLESDPVCWSNLSSPNHIAAEFDTVLIQCDLNYIGRWFTTMEWSIQTRNRSYTMLLAQNESLSFELMSSFVILQVNSDYNDAVIICKTYFSSSGNQFTTNASNDPDYTYHWNMTLNVEYGPKNISITPVLDGYETVNRLVCQADANPTPSYKWKDTETSGVVDGCEIIIVKNVKEHDAEYVYVCIAETWVRGHKRSASFGYTVKIKGSTWLVIRGYIFGLTGVVAGIVITAVIIKLRTRIRATNQEGSEQRKSISDAPASQSHRDLSVQQPVDQYEVMRRSSLDTINEGSQTQEHDTPSLYATIEPYDDIDQSSVYYNLPPT